jgi:hypothetical protein
VVGGAVALGVIGLMPAESASSAAHSESRKPRPRSEFKALVGKSQDEVKAAVGAPDSDGGDVWMFYARGIDPQTNAEGNVKVVFKAGRVSEVTFQ